MMEINEQERYEMSLETNRMNLKTKLMLGLGAVMLIAVVAVGAVFYGARRNAEPEKPVVTADLLGQSLRTAQELVSVSYHYTNMARYENQKEFYGWKIPFTSKYFIASYDGVIKAGIDLSTVTPDVNEGKKLVTVKLPESQVISHEIKEDSLTVYDESNNLLNRISINDYAEFATDQKAVWEEHAIENGLLTEAGDRAKEVVESLLNMVPGMEEYTLQVE
ncbi:MAG: DUF4230 domain-containing protein [Oscillospiraceae bacterium]|nr:DUF4230 domain-containing protein [Oscillospiraceae bacterium]